MVQRSLALVEGSLFNGRYRVVRCIAMGGMGAVYEVIHEETERRRALKVMLPHLLQSDEMRVRFRQEARVAGRIDSEFIVDVFDAGIDEATGMPFLVMELLRGEELDTMLRRLGRLSAPEAVLYLYQTAQALDKSHGARVVHRDLKPANVFIERREGRPPRVKVLDFGIAKIVADGSTNAQPTRSLGTPFYMSPEQFQPGTTVSGASDIYALGMLAFTLLTGKPYWEHESRTAGNVFAFASIASRGPAESGVTRASRYGAPLPAAFDPWFARVTATAPEQRFSSAVSAILSLSEALGVPSPAPEVDGGAPLGRFTPSEGAPARVPNLPTSTEVMPPAPPPNPGATPPGGVGDAANTGDRTTTTPTATPTPTETPTETETLTSPLAATPTRRSPRPALIAGAVLMLCLSVGAAAFFLLPSSGKSGAPAALEPAASSASAASASPAVAGSEIAPAVAPSPTPAPSAAPPGDGPSPSAAAPVPSASSEASGRATEPPSKNASLPAATSASSRSTPKAPSVKVPKAASNLHERD